MDYRSLAKNGKIVLLLGGNGFIGHSLARKLKNEGYWVRCADIKPYEYGDTSKFCDDNMFADLRKPADCLRTLTTGNIQEQWDEVYQLAADMGGAGFVFSKEHDADIMSSSALININILNLHHKYKKIFYSSSACIYPEHNQLDPLNPNCAEDSAFPANPDSCYGWEKLFSERLYEAFHRNYDVDIRIARFHNIFGPEGTYKGEKEKAPAAICRKVIEAEKEIEIWGDGEQTRSFLYIDECLEGVSRLMKSDFKNPLNIGSDEKISINQLAEMAINISGKNLSINHINGPLGVRGRNSDNKLIEEVLGWAPSKSLESGLVNTYAWINSQINKLC